MPTRFREDLTPIVEFDPRLEVSPFVLFRRLRDGARIQLIDARRRPGALSLHGSTPYPAGDWEPADDEDVVLFDDDGSEARALVEHLQAAGHERVKMLFGGLELYEFALSPDVVGDETFLRRG